LIIIQHLDISGLSPNSTYYIMVLFSDNIIQKLQKILQLIHMPLLYNLMTYQTSASSVYPDISPKKNYVFNWDNSSLFNFNNNK
jgi:hypothetical protein